MSRLFVSRLFGAIPGFSNNLTGGPKANPDGVGTEGNVSWELQITEARQQLQKG